MNGILAFVLAALVYPGVLVAAFAAWVLTWIRQSVRAALSGGTAVNPLNDIADLRATFGRETIAPAEVYPGLLTFASIAAVLFPLIALILLPVPGNPLATALGLTGDLAAEGGLLLGLPLMRLLLGWAIPSPYTRLAADRGARLLAGAALPMVLALSATAEQVTTLGLQSLPVKSAPIGLALLTRLLAALAFVFVLPVLTRVTPLREGDDDLDLVADELTELSGRDLAIFRIGEAAQLVAVAGLFVAAFVLPLFATVGGTGRNILWLAGVALTSIGLGAWEALRQRQPLTTEERPPLNWWLGIPMLIALMALVAAAWAARSV